MEDWQEWQQRADEVAAQLGRDTDELEREFLQQDALETNLRAFWPRFRELKERVRVAPAIRLEDKLDLERRLRGIGSRAYKIQETVFAKSGERKQALAETIARLRAAAEKQSSPRELRGIRRELDTVREGFDKGPALAPTDRQSVWDTWREANQFVWQKLLDLWTANERLLREILSTARQELEKGNPAAARQAVNRFFETLRDREAKQAAIAEMKSEAAELRREAEALPERGAAPQSQAKSAPQVPAVDNWRAEVARNRELIMRLRGEVAGLEEQVQASTSILDQSMLRGTLVDKRRKLDELERSSRTLEQRIAQAEETPVLSGT
jgi:hypothetical protein